MIIWLWFLVHVCKTIISPGIFHFFKIFIFRVVSVEKMIQNDKKFCPSRSISQEPYIIWFSCMVHVCKIVISPGVFFILPKFLFFRWVNRKNRDQNDKKFCPLRSISQEPYIIYGANIQNDNISRHFVHFFKILIFWVVRWGVQKMVQNDTKFCPSCSISQESYWHDCYLWYTCVNQ